MPATRDAALGYAKEHLPATLDALKALVRIGGVSAEPAPSPKLAESARAVAAWMERVGLEDVEVLELEGVHPYVFGQWLHAPGAPTVLLYAHHDVQPTGPLHKWTSPPFEPEEREGRIYGRGVVDDKAGAAIHFAAIEAYLARGGLPLNIKFIVDGEEEIGSEHLGRFLAEYRDRLDADVIVLTDTANLAAGLPSITYGLRGLVVVDVEVRALEHTLHSGMWGGPVPDPALALCQILARLMGPDGRIAIDGIYDDVRPLGEAERQRLRALPYDEAEFRADAGILAGVSLAGEAGMTPYELLWRRPSLAISALEAAPLDNAPNQIVSSARARVGIRVVADMDAKKTAERLSAALTANPPWNVQVTTRTRSAADWWQCDPEGPAFAAAERALAAGFGKDAVYIGCGGTIPFVEPFARVLGGVPALLIGLEDPRCHAHGEDESLLVSDFVKAVDSAVHLYAELATLPRSGS
jgi:acetylornithine deacetylase/succinyl-diaminopimelate desuccinylase-like protein